MKKKNSRRLINRYKLKYLNFKINSSKKFKKVKKELSRLDYIKEIIKKKKKLPLHKKFKYKFKDKE